MQSRFWMAVLLVFVLIAASACGGGGGGPATGTSNEAKSDEVETYPVELPAGHGLTTGTVDVPAEGITVPGTGTKISCDNKEGCTLTITATQVTGQLTASSTGGKVTVTVAVAEITEPEPDPEPEPQAVDEEEDTEEEQPASTAEASQRAKLLEAALDDITGLGPATTLPSPVEITVPAKGRLTLKTSGKTTTLAGAGIRSTTFALTLGGSPLKRLVYTDRELTRQLLAHYGNSRDSGDMTRLDIANTNLGTAVTITNGVISETSKTWDIAHGVKTSLAGVSVDHDSDPATPMQRQRPANPENPKPKPKYSGKLHGVPGTFVCGGDTCQIQLTPTYEGSENEVGDSFDLTSVALSNVGGTGLFFKPTNSAATISLYEGGPVGTDQEYMVFGYWLESPKSPAEEPEFGVFFEAKDVTSSKDLPASINARYDGTAVGVYAEKDPNEAVDTWRQGEFTAAASLQVNGAPGTITGTIRNFTTMPTGGSGQPVTSSRWVVKLNPSNVVNFEGLAGATSEGDGSWTHRYTKAHATAASDVVPPGVVGAFEAEINNLLHMAGAFGAHKQ